MSTHVETGQAYAPSVPQSSSRWMPWVVGAVVAAVAIAAILAVNANVGTETEAAAAVNSAGLTQGAQAEADRLTGLAAATGAVSGPELARSLQAEADRLTGLAAAVGSTSYPVLVRSLQAEADRLTGLASQFATQAPGSVFTQERVRAQQTAAALVPSEYATDTAIAGENNLSGPGFIGQDAGLDEIQVSAVATSSVLTPIVTQQMQGFIDRLGRQELQASSGPATFSPEAVVGVFNPDIWIQPSSSGGEKRHEPR
jgi:hypothetical protein